MPRLKEFAIALSLANLCFLPEWTVRLKWTNGYFMSLSSIYLHLIALMLNIVLIAIIFLLALKLVEKINKPKFTRLGQYIFLASLILPINAAKIMANISLGKLLVDYKLIIIISAVIIIPIAGYIIFKYTSKTTLITANILLILSPFVLFTFGQSVWTIIKLQNLNYQSNQTKITETDRQTAHKVLWIIFDELDQRITFDERPDGLNLPEFDKLRDQSFYAENAKSPTTDTKESLPSLLTGKIIKSANETGPNELIITTDAGEDLKWSEQDNIFAKALTAGYTSAIAGQWYHPYCRIFGANVSNCNNENTREDVIYDNSLSGITKLILKQTYQLLPWWRRLPESQDEMLEGPKLRQTFQGALANTKNFALDENIDLTFAHLIAPHAPYFYDRETEEFIPAHKKPAGYLDGLVLADKALEEIRVELEQADLWNETTVIVSSDHHWRTSDTYDGIMKKNEIPFILKLPNQTENFTFDEEFNTVLTGKLILELLQGNLSSPTSTAEWILGNK